MAEKRLWRPIRLLQINILLYTIIALLGATTWRAQVWSSRALPRYFNNAIAPPLERQLYRKARRILLRGTGDITRAQPLLAQSIAIDPNAEGRFWLGKYYLALGETQKAAQAYATYLDIDPTKPDAYLDLAHIYVSMGRADDARQVLQRGLRFYQKNVHQLRPQPDAEVRRKYNKKAVNTHQQFLSSIRKLQTRLHEIKDP